MKTLSNAASTTLEKRQLPS